MFGPCFWRRVVKQSLLSQFVAFDFDINTLHYLLNVAQTNIVTEISLKFVTEWLVTGRDVWDKTIYKIHLYD